MYAGGFFSKSPRIFYSRGNAGVLPPFFPSFDALGT